MRRKHKLLSLIMAAVMSASMLPLNASAGETFVLSGGGQRKNPNGYPGYSYEIWIDNTGGSGTMTLNDGGAFDTEWNCSCDRGNFLARRGKDFGETGKATSFGNITLDYAAAYSQTGQYSGGGNSRLCVYGWMTNPLVEYYIIEDWINWCPGPDNNVFPAKNVTIDNAEYQIFWIWHEGPTIKGTNERFKQYFSIRKNKRTSGKITVSDHFKAWENAGMDIGNLYEVALNVEGWQSSGKANVTKNVVTVGGGSDIDDPPDDPLPSGYLLKDSFESGVGNWSSRGGTTVTSSSIGSSGKGVAVSGRTSNWNGVSTSLSTSTFKPGTAYSFSVMAMQNAASSDNMKLTLQYNLNGTESYANIAEATAKKGEWVQLANTKYTIPSGATDLVLYVEADSDSNDFFIDEAAIATSGTVISGANASADRLGDVNSDGVVNSFDMVELIKYTKGSNNTINKLNADVNTDGNIDEKDVDCLKKLIQRTAVIADFLPQTLYPDPPGGTTDPGTGTGTTDKPVRKEGYYYNLADVSRIDPNKPMVAFAFDDGPIAGGGEYNSVQRIQDAVAKSGGHATFFYWGERIAGNENEIKRAQSLGFEIANHTWTHNDLSKMDGNSIRNEISRCAAKLKEITGLDDFLLRPPYLGVNATVQQNCGCALVNCGLDTGDWQSSTTQQQIIDKLTSAANNGSLNGKVLLMHENYNKTAGAVEYIIPYLQSKGYQIVSVGEMFKAKGIDMKYGTVYNNL